MNTSSNVSIRLAVSEDSRFLPQIEKSAGELFLTLPELAWIADEPIESPEEFLSFIESGPVWVAEADKAGLVGELRGQVVGDVLHIAELAVVHAFQQKGIGRALIDAAKEWAGSCGLRALTLTTFRHVARNAPFYARYGFRELSGGDERLVAILLRETARGLPNRCAMRFDLK
jgi:GNAT superfamily N-acetyltransferase